jgi:hypothetical protein
MRTLLALIASAGLVGCVGDVSDMPTPPPDETPDDNTQDTTNPAGGDLTAAKMAFDSNVYPVINMKCSGGACHSQAGAGGSVTKFVATNAADGWQVATGFTALVGNFTASAAPILTMIKPGTHKAVTYTTTEEANIVAWLDLEVAARNGQTNNPPPTGGETLSQATERVLSQFAGCMKLTDFQAANMAQEWGGLDAQNNTECDNCHATGGEGFIASRVEGLFYDVVSTKKYYFLQYFTVDLTQGAAMAKVVMNRASFLGVANGQDPHREHPRFNAGTNTEAWQALTQFYNATQTNIAGGQCQPKPLQNQ